MEKRTNLILLVLASLIGTLAILPGSTQLVATLDTEIVDNPALGIGSTFTIEINITNVERMYGFNLFLYYDTNVLTATSYDSYYPFDYKDLPHWIDDAKGEVELAYSYPPPEYTGLYAYEPTPIAYITFTVDDLGSSKLDIMDSVISDVDGNAIAHQVGDGFFINSYEPRLANLVGKSAWPEHHHWNTLKYPTMNLIGKVANLGTTVTRVYVKFHITSEDGLWSTDIETEIVSTKPGTKTNIPVTISLAQLNGLGGYKVQAQAWYDDGTGTFLAGTKIKSFSISAL